MDASLDCDHAIELVFRLAGFSCWPGFPAGRVFLLAARGWQEYCQRNIFQDRISS